MTKYLFRVDDVSEYMDLNKFNRLKKLFLKYNIKPILGIVPKNKDKKIIFQKNDRKKFFSELKKLKEKGWTIAMHGYNHKLEGNGGMLKINSFGEFGGIDYNEQLKKIRNGKEILKKEGLDTDIFIAPAHSFDLRTLEALKKDNFEVISDGIGFFPYERNDFLFIPQIVWHVSNFPIGVITFGLHPQDLDDKKIKKIEEFIKKNKNNITDVGEITKGYKKTSKLEKKIWRITNFIFRLFWYLALKTYKITRK